MSNSFTFQSIYQALPLQELNHIRIENESSYLELCDGFDLNLAELKQFIGNTNVLYPRAVVVTFFLDNCQNSYASWELNGIERIAQNSRPCWASTHKPAAVWKK